MFTLHIKLTNIQEHNILLVIFQKQSGLIAGQLLAAATYYSMCNVLYSMFISNSSSLLTISCLNFAGLLAGDNCWATSSFPVIFDKHLAGDNGIAPSRDERDPRLLVFLLPITNESCLLSIGLPGIRLPCFVVFPYCLAENICLKCFGDFTFSVGEVGEVLTRDTILLHLYFLGELS